MHDNGQERGQGLVDSLFWNSMLKCDYLSATPSRSAMLHTGSALAERALSIAFNLEGLMGLDDFSVENMPLNFSYHLGFDQGSGV